MAVRLQASLQSLVFLLLLAGTLFGAAGRIDIIEFWVYVAILAAVSVLSLSVLDPDLMQERMRPGGHAWACDSCRLSSSCSCTGQWPALTEDGCMPAT